MKEWLVRTNVLRAALTVIMAASLLPAAHALRPQQPGDDNAPPPPQNGGGFGGGFGGGGQGGGQGGGFGGRRQGGGGQFGGMMMQPRDVKSFQVPAATLASLLKLSGDQKTQVAAAVEHLRTRTVALRQSAMSAQTAVGNGGSGDNGDGNPPRMQQMGGGRPDPARMQALNASAQKEIDSILNADQKQRLPTVLAAIRVLRDGGVPIPLTGQLNLSDDQVTQLAALAPKDNPQADGAGGGGRQMQQPRPQQGAKVLPANVAALLTSGQKDWIEPWLAELPTGAQGGGGMGGPGGPGGGGFAFGGRQGGRPGGFGQQGGPGGGPDSGPDGAGPPPQQ